MLWNSNSRSALRQGRGSIADAFRSLENALNLSFAGMQVADANAHLIRSYDAWVIALLLSRAGMYMHTYPQAFFSVREWEPALGYEPCFPTRVPDQRRADYGMTTAMLFTDAAQTLQGQQLGIFGRYAPRNPSRLLLS